MKQQLFGVSAKNRKTRENISLQVWAENVDAATHSLTDALFGAKGAYVWTGSAPEHENNEVIKREIDEGSRGRADKYREADVLEKAIQTYGKQAQVDMMIEEMAELTKALMNERRGRENNIAEELADVKIMLLQMVLIFDNAVEVEKIAEEKVERLDQRLHDKKGAAE